MAANHVENILHFAAKIIPKAYCFPDWNQETMKIAYQWALLSEKVYAGVFNQPYAANIDKLISQTCQTLNKNGVVISLEDLKLATELLTKAFFQNPHVDDEMVQTALAEINQESNFISILEDTCSLNSMSNELLESLKPLSSTREVGKSLYHEVKAEILIEYLLNTTCQMPNDNKAEKLFSSVLESMLMDEDKSLIYLCMLNYTPPNTYDEDKVKTMLDIQEFCLSLMVHRIASHEECPIVEIIWKQPPSVLHNLATKSTGFCSYYINQLTNLIDTLGLVEEEKWKTETLHSGIVKFEFEDTLCHLRNILENDGDINEKIKRRISSKIHNDNSHVWKKINLLLQ